MYLSLSCDTLTPTRSATLHVNLKAPEAQVSEEIEEALFAVSGEDPRSRDYRTKTRQLQNRSDRRTAATPAY